MNLFCFLQCPSAANLCYEVLWSICHMHSIILLIIHLNYTFSSSLFRFLPPFILSTINSSRSMISFSFFLYFSPPFLSFLKLSSISFPFPEHFPTHPTVFLFLFFDSFHVIKILFPFFPSHSRLSKKFLSPTLTPSWRSTSQSSKLSLGSQRAVWP